MTDGKRDVEDLDRSLESCAELGGSVIAGPKRVGSGRYCVIRDTAGAVLALIDEAGSAAST